MRFKPLAVLAICLLGIFNNLRAEKAPMKYGKIDESDLSMTVYDKDSSAVAVVLCHYGVFNSDNISFSETIRVKILKESGTSFGSQVFSASSEGVQVRGKTFNMENGVLVEEKLKSESVFKERLFSNYYRLRVAMPNVKVGSIIDIEVNYNGFPNEWRFQSHIPVRYSEVVLNPSPYIEYSKNSFGFEPFAEASTSRWVCKDLPAFKEEAYMNSSENYMNKMEFDIRSISIPGQLYKSYTTSWNAVNELFMKADNYGQVIEGPCVFLNDIVKEIEAAKPADDMAKMQMAYEAIKRVKWNERCRITTSSNQLGTPFKEGAGNSTEINLMLVKLMRKLNLKSYPVAISTRDNGIISLITPSLNRLNSSICLVYNGDQQILLDATEKYLPFGLLPYRDLNFHGRIIDETINEWVNINPQGKEKEMFSYDLSFDEQMQLQGTMTNMRSEYSAYYFRKNYFSFASKDEYQASIEKLNPGMVIEDMQIENLDSINNPIVEKFKIKANNKTTIVDSMVIINPMLFDQITENPFKLEQRKYPVDFATNRTTNYICKIKIPEGYTVSELPKAARMKLPNDGISFMISYAASATEIVVNYRFNINKTVYNENEYALIKELYNNLVKKHAEPVVLKKS
jgi:hypothetical protein